MEVFKIDRKTYLTNEFLSWIWAFSLFGVIVLLYSIFSKITWEKIEIAALVVLLLKISNTITTFRIKEIKIDEKNNRLIFLLGSLLSGTEEKSFDLNKIQSTLKKDSKFLNWFYEPLTLKILLPENKIFKVNSRYGFSKDTLKEIETTLIKYNS